MRFRITLGKLPWEWRSDSKVHLPPLKKTHGRLLELFAPYGPKLLTGTVRGSYGYPTHELSAPADDAKIESLTRQFDKEIKSTKPAIAGFFFAIPTQEEVKRARFLEPLFFGHAIDEDDEPLNPPARILCNTCKFPDITRVPEPFLVSKAALKKHDIFSTTTGMIVVRAPVLELLKAAIGSQIESGPAVIAKSKEKLTGDNRLFWVRAKEMLGDRLLKVTSDQCPACKRVLSRGVGGMDKHVANRGPGLLDARDWLEHFGSGKADFAIMGGFHGSIKDGISWHWPILMSGALVAHLIANRVKGISASTAQDDPQVYFSRKGDPTLEPRQRTFGAAAAAGPADESSARIERGRQITASLSTVPWDCNKDGYVYFYLTTPEVIVIDPMTWEEDSGGPYHVPNFKKPGLYRLPVSAIKNAKKRGVTVDSGTLLFIDNAFFPELPEHYEWDKAQKPNGSIDTNYHNQTATQLGSRFGICSAPPNKFKSEFVGDGFYTVDAKAIELAST